MTLWVALDCLGKHDGGLHRIIREIIEGERKEQYQ